MKLKEILALLSLPFVLLFIAVMSKGVTGINLFLAFLVILPLEIIYILYKLRKIKIGEQMRAKNVLTFISMPLVILFAAVVFGDAKHTAIAGVFLIIAVEIFIFDFLFALIYVVKHTSN